jgi:hypothetical protein
MFIFFIVLSFISTLFSNESSLVVTENDPSTLVEGVNVITGELYALQEDYVVQGAEPISFRRSFLSREGIFQNYQKFTATFFPLHNMVLVHESNGSLLNYYFYSCLNHRAKIGKEFYSGNHSVKNLVRYQTYDFTQKAKGVCNTKSGQISAQTHLKNQYIIFNPTKDPKGKSFTLYASNGTERRYVGLNGQKKEKEGFCKGEYFTYNYKFVSETLPNGHMIHYNWTHENRLDSIYTTNRAETKVFAKLKIPLPSRSNPSQSSTTFTGSDGRSLQYCIGPSHLENVYAQSAIICPELPSQNFIWDIKNKYRHQGETKVPHLTKLFLPQKRALQITYNEMDNTLALSTVKTLSSPVGIDDTMVVTHSFFYDKPNKNSYVLDAKNNKTAYFWNDDYRLTCIERYDGKNLYNKDTFVWENTHLKCKTLHDQNGNPILSRVLNYDSFGNVETDTLYGNLSGKGPELKIKTNGLPEEAVETFIKRNTYTQDGRNLLEKQEDPNGLCIKYTYRKDAHLPGIKSICQKDAIQIQTTYEYDEDLILHKETTKDALSKICKKITPCNSGPYIGMPEIVEELYGNDILLKKTVLHYGIGASIIQKDIYDANNQKRFNASFG